jgi:hypothetical protein
MNEVNRIKNVVINDEWETYLINYTVFQPFEDNLFDMRIEGNRPELDHQVLKKRELPVDWMPVKYGQKMRPYELDIKVRQNEKDISNEESGKNVRFEYYYSMKKFETGEIVYEREPHRVLEIQDPILYRGELAH